MSVLPSDIVVYGSANMPEADGAITGGAIDFTRRVAFYDIASVGSVDVISSSSSDTATKITYCGRDPTGEERDADIEWAVLGDWLTVARAASLCRVIGGYCKWPDSRSRGNTCSR